jgi:hypothetical protein
VRKMKISPPPTHTRLPAHRESLLPADRLATHYTPTTIPAKPTGCHDVPPAAVTKPAQAAANPAAT